MHKYVFNERLLNFISTNIFRSVNDICKKEGKYLVNVMCFDDNSTGGHVENYKLTDTDFPILSDLTSISDIEQVNIGGYPHKLARLLVDAGIPDNIRAAHMNEANNTQVARIVADVIQSKQMNRFIKLMDEYTWSPFDEKLQNLYGKD